MAGASEDDIALAPLVMMNPIGKEYCLAGLNASSPRAKRAPEREQLQKRLFITVLYWTSEANAGIEAALAKISAV
ncbi:MAG: hypothetical protein RMN52_12415 [Anaerolineae bacterium]|nr:hypothetical protein [Candidatus Roseilinea sp.]MDW8450795.1 hypothetical protein [Anaerolineae bacterium]